MAKAVAEKLPTGQHGAVARFDTARGPGFSRPGAFAAMWLFRHNTRERSFGAILLLIVAALQAGLLI